MSQNHAEASDAVDARVGGIYAIFVPAILAFALAACAPSPTGTTASATAAPTAASTHVPGLTPSATATPAQVATPQASTAQYQGFVVYDESKNQFTAYDFEGRPLNLTVSTGRAEQYPSDEIQVVGNAIYYRDENKAIIRADAAGSRTLTGIPSENLSAFKVSPDEALIAWTSNLWEETPARSELWIASLDGSSARRVVTSTTDTSGELFVPTPYRWTDDGKLLYVETPTGIGGYILYRAYSSLHLYDPTTGEIQSRYEPEDKYRVCLSDVASDLSRVGFGCGEGSAGMVSILTLSDAQTARVPDLPEQGQAGDTRFSPSGTWLAYAIGRGDPERERGQVAVVPTDLSVAPSVIASEEGGIYHVIDWIDEDTLLLHLTLEGQGSVWRANRDGSDLKQLATGSFVVGMIAND